jgi:hypothetical protein
MLPSDRVCPSGAFQRYDFPDRRLEGVVGQASAETKQEGESMGNRIGLPECWGKDVTAKSTTKQGAIEKPALGTTRMW